MIENMWTIIFGNFIVGLSAGFIQTSSGRTLEEFVPFQLYGFVVTIFYFFAQLSLTCLTILMSSWMPEEGDDEGFRKNWFWRIYIGCPVVFCIIVIVGVKFIIKHEPPKYLISLGRDKEALASI